MTGNARMAAFVRARLDEAERDARAAKPGPWHADGGSVYATHPVDEVVDYTESADHIARQDPARTLRRIAMQRELLDAYLEVADLDTPAAAYDYPHGHSIGLGLAVRQMAREHEDHPDYRPAWSQGFTD